MMIGDGWWWSYQWLLIRRFPKMWGTLNHPFQWDFPYESSILGYPHDYGKPHRVHLPGFLGMTNWPMRIPPPRWVVHQPELSEKTRKPKKKKTGFTIPQKICYILLSIYIYIYISGSQWLLALKKHPDLAPRSRHHSTASSLAWQRRWRLGTAPGIMKGGFHLKGGYPKWNIRKYGGFHTLGYPQMDG